LVFTTVPVPSLADVTWASRIFGIPRGSKRAVKSDRINRVEIVMILKVNLEEEMRLIGQ
jgi:hypothetical protein